MSTTQPAGQLQDTVIKTGYLEKLTAKRTLGAFFGREWKRRWVVIRHDTIAYYRDRTDFEPKGSIHRMLVADIAVQGSDAYERNCPDTKKQFGFSVLAGQEDDKDPLQYHFAAEDADEMKAWLDALTQWHTGDAAGRRGTELSGSLEHAHGDKVLLNDFKPIKRLGRGGTAHVWMVKDPKGHYFAKKTIPTSRLNARAYDAVLQEAQTLKQLQALQHPYLVKFHQWFAYENHLHLILEYCMLGNLYELKSQQEGKRFTPQRTRVYMAETACAMNALHSLRLTHYDLKLENLLLDQDGHIKLCDFGFTKATDDGEEAAGYTEIYASPEMLKHEPTSHAVDWWALGVLMYECMNGNTPFKKRTETIDQMKEHILDPNFEIPPLRVLHAPDEAHNLVCQLLNHDSSSRLQNIEEYFLHPFNVGLTEEAFMKRQVPIPNDSFPTRCSISADCENGSCAESM